MKPTSTFDRFWIIDMISTTISKNTGKWLLFVDQDYVDELWKKVQNFLHSEDVPSNVVGAKVSTMKKNPRASADNFVICVYCRNSEQEQEIMQTGEEIIDKIGYQPSPYMHYKTDEQTMQGTRATGQKRNWKYRIQRGNAPRAESRQAPTLQNISQETREQFIKKYNALKRSSRERLPRKGCQCE